MDVLKNSDEAIRIAKDALEEGVDKLEKIDDNEMKEVTTALQLLKDNVDAWSKDKVDDI